MSKYRGILSQSEFHSINHCVFFGFPDTYTCFNKYELRKRSHGINNTLQYETKRRLNKLENIEMSWGISNLAF